ncbi:MAG: MurR/RpiR family transcriptional regulator [Pseudomonadota bacterium]|nr:MurR/RpiR family transcriptional regulator [Pseudomonadota bacterium]
MAATEVDTPAPDPPAEAEDDSIVALVGRHYPTLSPGHRRVADFILASPHQAALMTLDDIADATGVSKATANRLAARIGLPGYPELKRRLRAQLQQALSPVEDLLGTLRVQNFSRTAPWTQSILEDLERLRSIDAVGGDAAFTRASALLARAERVFLLGLGSSAFIAGYAGFALATLRDGVRSVADASGVEGAVRRLTEAGEKDAALLISFARYSAQSLRLAELLHAQRVPIVCVADSPDSPVARLADSCFVVERKPGFVVSSSGTGAMAAVEALIRGTAAAIGAEAVEARAARLTELLGDSVIEPKA